MSTRTGHLDDPGDLNAQKGSLAWAIAVRDEINSALHDNEFSAAALREWYSSIVEHDGWRVLMNTSGKIFASRDEFSLHRRPFGLGLPLSHIERITQTSTLLRLKAEWVCASDADRAAFLAFAS